MIHSFEYDTIDTAPKDRQIALWCPRRQRWLIGRWDDGRYYKTPKPYWSMSRFVNDDRSDQPTHWAALSALRIQHE